MTAQTHDFTADTGKILNIVINSLYSDRDIFLRELLSNASDAIHKRKLLGQSTAALLNEGRDEIIVTLDAKQKTLTITDTGIGLDADELTQTLGTIARSGTAAFLGDIADQSQAKDAAKTLIGQFGVGFYSAFMVAEQVTVTTRKAGTDTGHIWQSDGTSGYTITPCTDTPAIGTSLCLKLRKDAKDYADATVIKGLIKKYSDHITVPILLQSNDGPAEQANSAQALWARAPADLSAEDYSEFYQSTFGAFDTPFLHIHTKTEGTLEFTTLLYVPGTAPFDLYEPERKTKLRLYINRVFISQDVDGLLPSWLRFVQGVLDTTSLDLNVSRELVQQSPVIRKISKSITKRVLSELKKKHAKDGDAYGAFWAQFGKVLKEGLYEDADNREKIAEIILVRSMKHEKMISLQAYIDAMPEGQDSIYVLSADSLKQAVASPHLEAFKAKDLDVLLMTDPIDAFWIAQMGQFKGKSFVSIARDEFDLSQFADTEARANTPADAALGTRAVAAIKAALGDMVEDVRASDKLVNSPARLVAGSAGLDFNLERILKAQNPEFEGSKKVLEINAGHDLVAKISTLEGDVQAAACRILFEQARLLDGEMPTDPKQFQLDFATLAQRL